jgi:peptidoglycan LD-endopeptidase CwlK
MPAFGQKSRAILDTVDPALVAIMERVVRHRDITIISGKRDKAEQDELVRRGLSKTRYPHSKHNQSRLGSDKSLAVDIAPYPIRWTDVDEFIYVAGMVMQVAYELGIRVRCGINWDGDDDIIDDQTFQDYGHFELVI